MKFYKDRYYFTLSLIAAFVSFILYYITKAPTVSFWDCGEFIATSYILGVPHPPGNPLYILMGRLFSMLPIASNVAVRINLISVLSSAAAVFVAYWLILRLAIGNKDLNAFEGTPKIAIGVAALSGSLIMGFACTVWSNAVEAEVYGLAMLLMLLIAYIALLWARDVNIPGNDRKLILIAYLLWLSLGIHMTTYIIAIPVILYLGYIDYTQNGFEHWPIWIFFSLSILYAAPIQTPLLSIVGIDVSAFELESFVIIMAIALVAILVMLFRSRSKALPSLNVWVLALMIFSAAAIGYSTQAYIPIRAAEKPIINENDPSNWPRFKAFLERKQYGQESMITRMFKRRASWENQFISHPSFGLVRLLSEQYSSPKARLTIYSKESTETATGFNFGFSFWLIYILFFGVIGIVESIKRSPPNGWFIVLAMLLCTVGLVLYLNFSDGMYNRAIAPNAEVRDRDYFYTPGFILYGILIGVGLAAFLEWAARSTSEALRKNARNVWAKPMFYLALIGALFLPIHTAFSNFEHNDRRGNYFPWDYASNILQSCDPNAILFTNGDNDTFPLWFIQQVDKVRPDVRVVNLSLLNTPWYIHQIKDQMGAPINLSYDEIENLRAVRYQGSDQIWRVQDLMVREIINNSQQRGWNPPVYFAMTVSNDNKLGLDDHLIQEGMALRIVESTGQERINTDVGERIFGNPAHFRGIADPHVTKDDNDRRLITNYLATMFQIAEVYQGRNQGDSAITIAEKAVTLNPVDNLWQARGYLASLYAQNGRYAKFDSLIAAEGTDGENICLAVSQNMLGARDYDRAIEILNLALRRYPSSVKALNNLAYIYLQKGEPATADMLFAEFRQRNSANAEVIKALNEVEQKLKQIQLPPMGSQ